MAESGLDSLRETHTLDVAFRAYELRPHTAPPLPAEVEERFRKKISEHWPRVQATARERFGLELTRMEGGHHPTRLAHIGAKYAIAQSRGEAYHRAVFRAHWQELRDISSPDTLAEIAVTLGLDEASFRSALTDKQFIAEVEADEYWAYQQGLSGVPAFIFGNRYLVSGAQPVEVLRQVADQCLAEGLAQ